ncbi:hypothetical protein NLQ73_24925, partial [Escherichia coli]|nr:hypothetical protein [Escherichia coli]
WHPVRRLSDGRLKRRVPLGIGQAYLAGEHAGRVNNPAPSTPAQWQQSASTIDHAFRCRPAILRII